MADVPATAKKPADRKQKKDALDEVPEHFTFEYDGVEYKFERPTAEVITPGWIRRNRKVEELDATYSAIEQLASDDVLSVLDNMPWAEHFEIQAKFGQHVEATMGASLGESTAS